MRKHCKDCDQALEPNQKTRCDNCWLEVKRRWHKGQQTFDNYRFLRLYTRANSNDRPHKNAVYLRGNESLEHFLEKAKVVWEHHQEGHICVTEAQREDRKIVDVICDSCFEIEIKKTSGDEERYAREGIIVRKI